MNGTEWESEELELLAPETEGEPQELRTSRLRITALKRLTLQLVREVQSIGEVKVLDIDSGLDFYNEVTRFEIDLISRALIMTGGHQARAAKLLNLKGTTLNSKIKSYNIKPESFAGTTTGWKEPPDEESLLARTSGGHQSQDSVLATNKPSFA